MIALVTGGAGFIGSSLCEELLKRGDSVISLDNFSTGTEDNIKHILDDDNFSSIRCDIRDKKKMQGIFKEESIDIVYHLAAIVGVKRTLENPDEVWDVNLNGTKNVLEAAKESSCKKVVNASSSEVYGEPSEIPEKETSPKNAKIPYALAKLKAEVLAKNFFEEFGLKTTSLRYFNSYGPRQVSTPYGFVVAIFIENVLAGKPPIIFGDGSATRDFTFVKDSVEATIFSGKKDSANGKSINVGTGREVTILDLANVIIDLCGKDLEPVFEKAREHEIMRRCADITKMKEILGFEPKTKLEDGLENTIQWYRGRENG